MSWLSKLLGKDGKKPKVEVDIDEEIRYLKRIQEIITLTDTVHTSLEKSIRKRLPPVPEDFEEVESQHRPTMRNYR